MAATNSMHVMRTSRTVNLELLAHLPESITLLELVYAISAVAEDDRVVVNTVVSMLTSGRVQLRGNFRDDPVEDFEI